VRLSSPYIQITQLLKAASIYVTTCVVSAYWPMSICDIRDCPVYQLLALVLSLANYSHGLSLEIRIPTVATQSFLPRLPSVRPMELPACDYPIFHPQRTIIHSLKYLSTGAIRIISLQFTTPLWVRSVSVPLFPVHISQLRLKVYLVLDHICKLRSVSSEIASKTQALNIIDDIAALRYNIHWWKTGFFFGP